MKPDLIFPSTLPPNQEKIEEVENYEEHGVIVVGRGQWSEKKQTSFCQGNLSYIHWIPQHFDVYVFRKI